MQLLNCSFWSFLSVTKHLIINIRRNTNLTLIHFKKWLSALLEYIIPKISIDVKSFIWMLEKWLSYYLAVLLLIIYGWCWIAYGEICYWLQHYFIDIFFWVNNFKSNRFLLRFRHLVDKSAKEKFKFSICHLFYKNNSSILFLSFIKLFIIVLYIYLIKKFVSW